MTMETKDIKTCAHCSKEDPRYHCGRCEKKPYCSKECQHSDWKLHSQWCLSPEEVLKNKEIIDKAIKENPDLFHNIHMELVCDWCRSEEWKTCSKKRGCHQFIEPPFWEDKDVHEYERLWNSRFGEEKVDTHREETNNHAKVVDQRRRGNKNRVTFLMLLWTFDVGGTKEVTAYASGENGRISIKLQLLEFLQEEKRTVLCYDKTTITIKTKDGDRGVIRIL
jgi:hypothetical protein